MTGEVYSDTEEVGGSSQGGAFSFFSDITGAITDVIGGSTKSKVAGNVDITGKATNTRKGTTTEGLEISQEAVNKIIQDVLGGADGLAAIFAGEQSSGIFNSSVAAQAAGDLASKIVGEIAKLRAKKVVSEDITEEQTSEQKQRSSTGQENRDKGILGSLGDMVGF